MFKKIIFESFEEEEVKRYQMDGLGDPAIVDFDFLTTSPFIKKEFREKTSQNEYIKSYLEGAKRIAQSIQRVNGIKPIYDFSLALPIVFLCRQAIELSIKLIISKKRQNQPKKIHNLNSLWEDMLSLDLDYKYEEKELLKNMKEFVELISSIDKEGTRLRYPMDGKDKYNYDKVIFINVNKLIVLTEKFCLQLEEMI